LPGSETEAVKAELKWLSEQLGPARDLDVLIEQRVRKERRGPPLGSEIDLLEDDLQARRDRQRSLSGTRSAHSALGDQR
jgi:CHAD domain-containing protein